MLKNASWITPWIVTGLYVGSTLLAQALAAVPTPRPTMPRQPSKPGVFVPNPNPPPRCPNPKRTGCNRVASDLEFLNLLMKQNAV